MEPNSQKYSPAMRGIPACAATAFHPDAVSPLSPEALKFVLKSNGQEIGTLDCPILIKQAKSVVIQFPDFRMRLRDSWFRSHRSIHAERFGKWVNELKSASVTQQLILLRDPIVLADRIGGTIDILIPAPADMPASERENDTHYRGTTIVWVPLYATGKVGESGIGAELWMINEILEASSRQTLDLDPSSIMPIDQGYFPLPYGCGVDAIRFAAAVRKAFHALGVPAEYEALL